MRMLCVPICHPVPFLFSLLVISGFSAKILHIGQHIHSLPIVDLAIYLPTLFFPDLFIICLGRLLLTSPETRIQRLGCLVGGVLSITALIVSAVDFGFFFETGAEVEWSATASFLGDPAAMKILMSGIQHVMLAGTAIVATSWMLSPQLHTLIGSWLLAIPKNVYQGEKRSNTLPLNRCSKVSLNFKFVIPATAMITSLGLIQAMRPSVPYNHLSAAVPLTLLDALRISSTSCSTKQSFPFPRLISAEFWERPKGFYPGWAPGNFSPLNAAPERPPWLPEIPPSGFERWKHGSDAAQNDHGSQKCSERHQVYNPVTDPLKISNLDLDILAPLRQVFEENSVDIKHIIMVTLESGRKDVFPMQESTLLHDEILNLHDQNTKAQVIGKLSKLTPVAQMVTGEYALTSEGRKNNFSDAVWQDRSAPGMGGINVKGAVTGSTLTFKSFLGSHCGVSPLPVDLLEESHLPIYQPCLPHILELFNRVKTRNSPELSPTAFQENPWKSVFVQSITDSYDRQKIMNTKIGFKQNIVKDTLERPISDHYPPKSPEINYFGYPEQEVEPYIRDLIFGAGNQTRLFLSHMTSTTHHPWKVPATWKKENYVGRNLLSKDTDLNDYLNSVGYVDEWLGKILGLLDEAGIANSTLVVVVGDHGQAFSEDTSVTGTYENPHISNFRVPLVFRHPHLPRIDISANVTALSIIPTILDLLIHTGSINAADSLIASSLIHEYQGQSLLRPVKTEHNGRHLWNIGIINAGGKVLSVTSASSPFRLILPLKHGIPYRFSHTILDPGERQPLEGWALGTLQGVVSQTYGKEAAAWVAEAEKLGTWWVGEQKRLWNYFED